MNLNLDFAAILERWPAFLDGALLTLQLAFIATALGSAIGVLGAIGRRSNHPMISRICGIYVEAIRNTPLLVQIFLVYFGLASLGLKFFAFVVAAAALTINVGAYTTEIIRAGFDSIPRGQIEAGRSGIVPRPDLLACGHVAGDREGLPGADQPVRAADAGLVGDVPDLGRGADGGRKLRSVRHLPRLRDLYSRGSRLHRLSLVMRAGFWLLGLVIFPRRRRLGTPCEEEKMGGSLNANHLMFLGYGALWTIGLSLIGLLGGGLAGFIIALCRISPSRIVASQRRLCPAHPGHAASRHHVPDLFRPAGARRDRLPNGGGRLAHDLCQCLSRRDLARQHRVRPKPQWEAAEGLALSRSQRMTKVILPQAIRIATPPTVGFMVQIIKNTSLASVVGFVELARSGQIINNPVRALPDLQHHRRHLFRPLLPALAVQSPIGNAERPGSHRT